MNEILTKENIKIEDMIFEVRGKQVILSSNVAKLYKTETFKYYIENFIILNLPILASIPFKLRRLILKNKI